MKKVLSVLVAVLMLSLVLSACGGSNAPEGDLTGKTSPVVAAGASGSKWIVTFTYYFDATGFKALKDVLELEIKKAEKGKKKEQVAQYKEILKAYTADPLKVIKGVSVAGPFNGWKPGKDKLVASKKGKYTVFSVKKEWEFSGEKEMYKIVFSLNATDDVMKQAFIWVPDPMASELKDDGFGGKNSLLAIPGFKASDDKKDK